MMEKKLNLLSYPSSLGSPKIDTSELEVSKYREILKVNEYFKGKFDEILNSYEDLLVDYEINKQVFSSDYKFIPTIGEIYFLYERNDGTCFLSLIEPTHWNFKLMYKVKYNSNLKWDLIKE